LFTYPEAYEELKKIIAEPRPEFIKDSLIPLGDAILGRALRDQSPFTPIGNFIKINEYLGGGLREREFTILCGPTGAGKTTLLGNLAAQLIGSMVPVFIASVEVGVNDFIDKLFSIVTGEGVSHKFQVNEVIEKIGTPFLSQQTVFTNYDSRVPHLQLLCDILYAHRTKGTKVALIDNLNFIMEVSGKDEISRMDKAVHDFVVFCKKVPIHVIMVMHPRKTEKGRVESEYDIKGSSTAVQEASNVILFNRLSQDEVPPYAHTHGQIREIKFAKIRRNGRAVGKRVLLSLEGESERYIEVGM
jgi:archaellum biogenesis ATPase FlaH